MKFKDLKDNEIKYISDIFTNKDMSWDDDRIDTIKNFAGITERTTRKWLVKLGLSKTPTVNEPEVLTVAKKREHYQSKKIFLITSAQNATRVHKQLLTNMEVYAEFLDAEILVIPFRYKNPTSVFTRDQETDEWWD